MFPHIITIFNILKTDKETVFKRWVVKDVFYISEKVLSQDGSGEKYTNVHRVIFSNKALEDYISKSDFKVDSKGFTLNDNDIIVKDEIDVISNQNELKNKGYDYFLIKTISDNSDYGEEELRNIEITD